MWEDRLWQTLQNLEVLRIQRPAAAVEDVACTLEHWSKQAQVFSSQRSKDSSCRNVSSKFSPPHLVSMADQLRHVSQLSGQL